MSNNKKIINKEGKNNMEKKLNENYIECPNCGTLIEVSKEDYAKILEQVRTKEFEKDVKNNLEQQKEKFEKDLKIEKNKLEKEFTEKLHQQETDSQKVLSEKEKEFTKKLNKKDAELTDIKNELANKDTETQLEIKNAVSKKESELAEANMKNKNLESDMKVQKIEFQKEKNDLIHSYELQIEEAKHNLANLNSKVIGEDLEKYVKEIYQLSRRMFPDSDFHKDNDDKDGTKGDYIFKDYKDGTEYISIMVEVKNQSTTSNPKNRKKNAEHFKKLDEDRRKKDCEYAILVSNLEPESKLYNQGIVEVFDYEKMYVVRPQFFIQLLAILTDTALDNLALLQKIKDLENKNVDVSLLKQLVNEVVTKIEEKRLDSINKVNDTIHLIDITIGHCNKMKKKLQTTTGNLGEIQVKLEGLELETSTVDNILPEENPKELQKAI